MEGAASGARSISGPFAGTVLPWASLSHGDSHRDTEYQTGTEYFP